MASGESESVPRWRAVLLREAAGMRTWARWLLLPSLLMWPLWILTFGSFAKQLFLAFACAAPWLLAIALGGLGVAIEFVLRPPGLPRPLRRRGVGMALLATSLWGLVLGLRLDARFFMWWHERDLAQVVAAARTATAPLRRAQVEGYTVSVVGPTRAVLIHVADGGGFDEHGVAYDPESTLRAGWDAGLLLTRVVTLRRPWRIWSRDD